jgi:hypothetical protein
MALFVGEEGGGRRRLVEKSKSRAFPLGWNARKTGGLPTSPTAPAATNSILIFPFKKK